MKQIIKNGCTLLEALVLIAPDSSNNTRRQWLTKGRVTVNGEVEKFTHKELQPGDEVAVSSKERKIKGIKIVYEDSHLIVVEKPDRLLSVASETEKVRTAYAILKEYLFPKRPEVVHRLDQDTSGLMLFAMSGEGRDKLKALFEKHSISRSYVAIVEGHLREKRGTWQSYLYEDDRLKVHSTSNPSKGKIAITHYEVVGTSKNCSMLKVWLETGRKNQIRVHSSDAGHPVVGDTKYGGKPHPINRLFLHAFALDFIHPITKKEMHFESPVPKIFDRIIKVEGL